MVPLMLVLLTVLSLGAGASVAFYLFYKRIYSPAIFLTIAFFALLVLLLAALVQMETSGSSKSIWIFMLAALAPAVGGQTAEPAMAIMSITPFYAALFCFTLVCLVGTMVVNTQIATVQAVIFLIFTPNIATLYRNYMVLAAAVGGGCLVVCSVYSLVTLFTRPVERLTAADNPRGSDTFSHLLYYVSLVWITAASGFCGDFLDFVECLAMAFLFACAATAGIVAETLAFRGYSTMGAAAFVASLRRFGATLLRRARLMH
jgi:hypothetical protein